jgi:DNA-directed RNA polymerase specialized sigma24 family protein
MNNPTRVASDGRGTRWRAILSGASSKVVLGRLVAHDPLHLAECVARRLEEDAWLLDGDRVLLRAVALCARRSGRYHGRPDLETWLGRIVDEAVKQLMDEDQQAEITGETQYPAVYRDLARPLGLEPSAMRSACNAFNARPRAERQAFFGLVLAGRPIDEVAARHSESVTVVARRARRALDAVLIGCDSSDLAEAAVHMDATGGTAP